MKEIRALIRYRAFELSSSAGTYETVFRRGDYFKIKTKEEILQRVY